MAFAGSHAGPPTRGYRSQIVENCSACSIALPFPFANIHLRSCLQAVFHRRATIYSTPTTIVAFANTHAADMWTQTVAVVVVPPVATEPTGRGLTAITQDIAKVSIDLAHVEARRCVGESRALRIRKGELSAQLAALNAVATEAKRRATEQERPRDQANRAEELRESRRANPAAPMACDTKPSIGVRPRSLPWHLDVFCRECR